MDVSYAAPIGVLGSSNTGVQQVRSSIPSASGTPTPAAISFNGNLNVFKVGGDDQVYQTYWNGTSWSGFSSMGGSYLSNPAVIVHGTALNIFARGLYSQIYTEYN